MSQTDHIVVLEEQQQSSIKDNITIRRILLHVVLSAAWIAGLSKLSLGLYVFVGGGLLVTSYDMIKTLISGFLGFKGKFIKLLVLLVSIVFPPIIGLYLLYKLIVSIDAKIKVCCGVSVGISFLILTCIVPQKLQTSLEFPFFVTAFLCLVLSNLVAYIGYVFLRRMDCSDKQIFTTTLALPALLGLTILKFTGLIDSEEEDM